MDNKKTYINRMNQIQKGLNSLEEFIWFLDTNKVKEIKKLYSNLQDFLNSKTDIGNVAGEFVSPNPNIHFLIGVLPRLFQDKNLFPTNEDISDFANSVLNLHITRSEKRSKYELIGLIICETNDLNDDNLAYLVSALAKITGNKDKLQKIIAERQKSSFSWNETIQKIAEQNQ